MALEFEELAEMAHRLEDLLAALGSEGDPVGEPPIDLLLACGDAMNDLLAAYCAVPPRPRKDYSTLRRRLDAELAALDSPVVAGAVRRYRLSVTFSPDCKMRSVGALVHKYR